MSENNISSIKAREVLDSRGRPTVQVEIRLQDGSTAWAIAPSGASTGSAEALELRDGNASRYSGLGVLKAVENVNTRIAPALIGLAPENQSAIDAVMLDMDQTEQKTNLGGNAMIAVSLAAAHAGAVKTGVPLYQHIRAQLVAWCRSNGHSEDLFSEPTVPLPMTNMISGGLHAGGNLDFQDVLIMPVGAPDYPTCLEWIVRVYNQLSKLLTNDGYEGWLVGDEGGYGPRLTSNRQAVEFVIRAIQAAGLIPGDQVTLALDVAATHFYRDGLYHLNAEGGQVLTADQMTERLGDWVDTFPITSIEDGLAEDDWDGWQGLCDALGDKVELVGDDLFTTNVRRVRKGIELSAANSVLVKVNQIGTLSETFETMAVARDAGMSMVISARSGESEDWTLADLATAVSGDRIKIGSIVRSERLAKYNRLLAIAEDVSCGWV